MTEFIRQDLVNERSGELEAAVARKTEPGIADRQQMADDVRASPITEWEDDARNPWNWPTWKKITMTQTICSGGFLASVATSMITPARAQLMGEFGVTGTVALLPLTLYVLALGFGPVIGGPLSETVGRYPIYLWTIPLGSLFTLGAGFTHSFAALCVLRFFAGLSWGPILAVAAGSLVDTFGPEARGPPSALYVTTAFLGPGLGPVIGSFVVSRKGWRWTQWTIIFFAIFTMVLVLFTEETFAPVLKRRIAKQKSNEASASLSLSRQLRDLALVGLVRPVRMLFTEPVVSFTCLYVAVNFGTLFIFFAALPYTFLTVYRFSLEQTGLVFLSIVIGCLLGLVTIGLCDALLYRKQAAKFPSKQDIPPEYRLYPAIIGSTGLPLGLFWFGWTARSGILWASPAAALIPFSWGNLCVFVSTTQYVSDAYRDNVVASAISANSLARYGFAATFPLFTIQMYEKLGIDWASSLLGFILAALMPIPWVLYKFGPKLRAKSTL